MRHVVIRWSRTTVRHAIIDSGTNRVIERARDRMKSGQAIRANHARRDHADGGEQAERDSLAAGRVHVLEVPNDLGQEAQIALNELRRLHDLLAHDEAGQWGRFAVIASPLGRSRTPGRLVSYSRRSGSDAE